MITITSKSSDIVRLVERFEKMSQAFDRGPGIPVMADVGLAAMEDVEDRFNTKGYGTWVPLSPITIARKGSSEILIDTGNMRKSVGIGVITPSSITVTVPYAGARLDQAIPAKHQLGTERIPQRKIVEDTGQLRTRLTPIVQKWLQSLTS